MGLRRTYQSSLLFRNLSVWDNLFLAVRGVARGRFDFRRPRASHPSRLATDELLERVRLQSVAQRLVSSLSHGQQRQLEIGMALAGAPRLILFDEPAAGLSPGERRELVALLAALPEHMGFIIIEHDLDIALARRRAGHRHAQRPGAEARHAARDRERRRGGGDLHGWRPPPMSWFSRRRVEGGPGPILRVDRLNVYYGRAHAVQDVSLTLDRGILAVVGRNGMGKTTLCNAITGLVAASGSIKLSGAELVGLAPHAITGLRRRLRAAGPPRLAVAHGRRASATRRTQRPSRRLDDRAHLRSLPAARRAARQRRLPALRRRAADAGDRPRAAVQPAAAGDGRADRGPGAGDRRAGRRRP